jgi:PIN domain nuclease of toxin-antitoxin system
MRLLLDTHILIALSRDEFAAIEPAIGSVLADTRNTLIASAASLWEIAIKARLGKLDPLRPLDELADHFLTIGLAHLAVDHRHAVYSVDPVPPTRDPFDRLLLSQCAVEGLQLITTDRALIQHPLAWRTG